MKTNESIFEAFVKEFCKHCKNKINCQEKLMKRLDNTVKCYKYERIENEV